MYTGELMDANALVYLRARYYHPGLGVFASLDPVEGVNRYQYVGGNVVNNTDPSGKLWWHQRDLPWNDKPGFVSTLIQYLWAVFALPNSWHAEYQIIPGQSIPDLLHVHDKKVEIWEIKSNNQQQRDRGLQSIKTKLVPDAQNNKLRFYYDAVLDKEYQNPNEPTYEYDWRSHDWIAGQDFPEKIPVGITIDDPNELWFAGAYWKHTGNPDDKGLIIYWRERYAPDEPKPNPVYTLPGITEIPRETSDSVRPDPLSSDGLQPRKPETVLPGGKRRVEEEKAAICFPDEKVFDALITAGLITAAASGIWQAVQRTPYVPGSGAGQSAYDWGVY